MNIDGKVAVVEIPGGAVISEKVGAVELEAALDVRFKLGGFQAAIDGVKSAQVVAGVEVVDPSLRRPLPVEPRTILTLFRSGIASNAKSWSEELGFSSVFVHAAQKS